MSYCLDTDTVIEFFHGNENVVKRIKEKIINNEPLSVTPITLCELYRGAFLSQQPDINSTCGSPNIKHKTAFDKEFKLIEELLGACFVSEFTVEATRIFGANSANLIKTGKVINDADLLIASIVLANKGTLVTNNIKHFSRITGLKLESWG